MPDGIDDIAAWRRSERARLLTERQTLPLARFQAASNAIMGALPEILPKADVIGCYWPFRREPDCMAFMRGILKAGGTVALPIVVGKRTPLLFRAWNEKTKMEAGPWEILQPAEGAAVIPSAFIIPLVGFDEAGFRLGYGAGYYDMSLASLSPRAFTIGVGFEFSRLATIYPQPHDIPMNVIVTEECVRRF